MGKWINAISEKVDNLLTRNLSSETIDAAQRELRGEVVKINPRTGKPFDHVSKVRQAASGLKNLASGLSSYAQKGMFQVLLGAVILPPVCLDLFYFIMWWVHGWQGEVVQTAGGPRLSSGFGGLPAWLYRTLWLSLHAIVAFLTWHAWRPSFKRFLTVLAQIIDAGRKRCLKAALAVIRTQLRSVFLTSPFVFGWVAGCVLHWVQWWQETKVPIDDYVISLGWPLTFHTYGGFSGVSQTDYSSFVADLAVWSVLALIPGLLAYAFVRLQPD